MTSERAERWKEVKRLRRAAPRKWSLRILMMCLVGCGAGAWFVLDLPLEHPITGRSIFTIPDGFFDDVVPHVLEKKRQADGSLHIDWEWQTLKTWALERFDDVGRQGLANTLALSILSITLAALIAAVLALPAARTLTLEGGFLPAERRTGPLARAARWTVFSATRFALVVLRSIPEYIWAFLFLLLFGPVMLPGVIALALHNGGILGKLSSERIEDMNPAVNRSLAALGAQPASVTALGIVPRLMPQFLVYFFYRWETCLREAAILGILGLETIGFHIHHEFAQFHYDDALLFVLMNSVLVILADNLGSFARARVRASGWQRA